MTIPDPKIPGDCAPGRSRLDTWLRRRLGLNSIRGRYLLVAGLFVAIVLVAGWAAQRMVNQTSHQSTVNVTERELISRQLNDLSDYIWLTETALQGYLLTPEKQQRAATLGSIDQLIGIVEKLSLTNWAQHSPTRRGQLQRMTEDMQELRRQSGRLMEIRADAEKLFPAMRHMIDKMLPNNIRFLTLTTLAMDEARERRELPFQEEVHGLFAETRYAWAIMIGNFRVFVANRFGVFPGDPQVGMKNQHQQIEFYHEMVERHLAALARYEAMNSLEFQQGESLTKMRKISQE